jgi:hypothetical protein
MGNERTRFKKGVSGNPSGRPKEDPAIRKFKETTYKDFIDQLQKYGSLSMDEMEADLRRKDATMFERIFGKIIQQAANGERDGRQVLLERLWGKVKDQVEVTNSKDKENEELLNMIPVDELVAIVRKRNEQAKENKAAPTLNDQTSAS